MKYNGLIPSDAFPAPIENASTNTFFVHIHIPKTGGTTFNSILEKNFQSGFDRYEGRFIHLFPKVTLEQMQTYISIHYSIRAITSHRFTAILPYGTVSRPVVALAFMRDPVEQFFSLYFHLRRMGMHCPERELLLDEYIDFRIRKRNLINYCRCLSPVPESVGIEYVRELVASGNLFLLPLERYEDALQKLKTDFPDDFNDIYYNRLNVSPRDQQVTDEMRHKIIRHIPSVNFHLHELSLKMLKK